MESGHGWYDLFSRGARDWLRHNEKVREAVHQHLPELIANADVMEGGARTVRVPVRMLEHHHFRLLRPGAGTVRRSSSPTLPRRRAPRRWKGSP